MLGGGIFLIYKSVMEIHHKLEGEDPNVNIANKKPLSLEPGRGSDHAYRCRFFI